MTEKFACPRRAESYAIMAREDTWKRGHGLIGQKRGCSYCGSMHPEDFLQAVRDGKEVGPTDKSYKAYLHEPLTEKQKEATRLRAIANWVERGMTEAEAAALVEEDLHYGSGADLGKFYYQHLSPEQQGEFVRLYNTKAMKVGYPGYFYVWPFFCTPTKGA